MPAELRLPMDQIVAEYLAGTALYKLRAKYRTSTARLLRLLKKRHIEIRGLSTAAKVRYQTRTAEDKKRDRDSRLTEEVKQQVIDLYAKQGNSIPDIRKKLGLHSSVITRTLKEADVWMRGIYEAQRMRWAAMPMEKRQEITAKVRAGKRKCAPKTPCVVR